MIDFLAFGASAALFIAGFVATLALICLAGWLLMIAGIVIRDQYDRWADR